MLICQREDGDTILIVYEPGSGGFDLHDRLTADGIDCIVTPPSLIPTESGSKVKTDKKDSYKLAKLGTPGMGVSLWGAIRLPSILAEDKHLL